MSDVLMGALQEAVRLGHPSAGAPHVLLALLAGDRPSVARDVLLEAGVTREGVEAAGMDGYGPSGAEASSAPAGAGSTPAWHETAGRAEGLALAAGDGPVLPEHVLLALAWQPRSRWFADLLDRAGTSREAVVAALAARGVPVPAAPLPARQPAMTQAASFPRAHLQEVNRALRRRAPDLGWGIGADPSDPIGGEERMAVIAAAHVDVAGVLDEVVGPEGWAWLPGGATA